MKSLSLSLLLIGLVAVASADSLRSQIKSMNLQVDDALFHKNVKGFSKIMKPGVTSDFKYVEAGKTFTFDQMVSVMQQGLNMMTKMKVSKSEIVTLDTHGTTASGTTRHTMVGITMGPDKKSHTITYVGLSVDTYRKEDGKWKMVSMSWKDEKDLMDGKPISTSKQ